MTELTKELSEGIRVARCEWEKTKESISSETKVRDQLTSELDQAVEDWKKEFCEPLPEISEEDTFEIPEPYDNGGLPSKTTEDQEAVEELVLQQMNLLIMEESDKEPRDRPKLDRLALKDFLLTGLANLKRSFYVLDASRPWIVYWIVHALDLLNQLHCVPKHQREAIIVFLNKCVHKDGGYGGNPLQYGHLATTYASVMAIHILKPNKVEARSYINTERLKNFLLKMRKNGEGFAMHEGGEADIRGTYTALAVADILGFLPCAELTDGVAEWIKSCITFEGGMAGEPGDEAHGGYAFCGLAALKILGKIDIIDMDYFARWATQRQMRFSGGFQGRCNKLVDSCYSYWVGGVFPLMREYFESKSGKPEPILMNVNQLQKYILVCAHTKNGMRDKPGKSPDYYHTCYSLSGLSMAQNCDKDNTQVLGDPVNLLEETDPLYNLTLRTFS